MIAISRLVLFSTLVFCANYAHAVDTIWNFDNQLSASTGTSTMNFWDPDATGWSTNVTFDKASNFGISALPGGDADVMFFPAPANNQGFEVIHNAPANGSQANPVGSVANYTLIFDVYWPTDPAAGFRAIYQTDPTNSIDANFFVNPDPSQGIGLGNYKGSIQLDTWQRVAISVRAADGEGQWHRYINGEFVGGQGTTGSPISSRHAISNPNFLLFTDNNAETAPVYVSSVRFVDRQMTIPELIALGGPHAGGTNVAGADAPPLELLARPVEYIIAHRGRSCCAPENTVAAIDAAFDAGATAIEIDIRTSADGKAVLMHDGTVDRTTNGTGVSSSMTVAQLKTLDAGSWFDPTFAGEKVPTLAEALVAAHGRGRLLLDTKEGNMGAVINQALLDASVLLGETVDASAIWPWSGGSTTRALDYFNNIPNVETVHGSVPATDAGFQELKDLGVVGFDVGFASVGDIDRAHANDMFITEFTVLDPDEMRDIIARGADGMETDFPGILASINPIAGDANGDKIVDIDDYLIINGNFFDQVSGRTEGDLNGDGLVDFTDFQRWLDAFPAGPEAALAAVQAVPEPSSIVLILFSIAGLFIFSKKSILSRKN